MKNEVITVGQMLKQMETGIRFSLKVVSYDRKRKTGGEVKEYPEACLVMADEEKEKRSRPKTEAEQQREVQMQGAEKNPAHYLWYTRNIRLLQAGTPTALIRKIHPPLVVEFNGKKVVA